MSLPAEHFPAEQLPPSSEGIACVEKSTIRNLLFFAAAFLLFSIVFLVIAVPEELNKGSFVIPIFTAVCFVLSCLLFLHAIKTYLSYKGIGSVLLFLDPSTPGAGGDFGVLFDLKSDRFTTHTPKLNGTLTCVRSKINHTSDNSTPTRKTLWQQLVALHLVRSQDGFKVTGLAEIPSDCEQTQAWNGSNSTTWEFRVDGDLRAHNLGMFNRVWKIDITNQAEYSELATQMPANFIEKSNDQFNNDSNQSAHDQVTVTENQSMIRIVTTAGKQRKSAITFIFFAIAVFAAGAFSLTLDWGGGYLVMLFGFILAGFALATIGASTDTTLDKKTQQLKCTYKIFGISVKSKRFEIFDEAQFEITSLSSNNAKATGPEFYSVTFDNSDKKHTVVYGIEGRRAAQVLRDKLALSKG